MKKLKQMQKKSSQQARQRRKNLGQEGIQKFATWRRNAERCIMYLSKYQTQPVFLEKEELFPQEELNRQRKGKNKLYDLEKHL